MSRTNTQLYITLDTLTELLEVNDLTEGKRRLEQPISSEEDEMLKDLRKSLTTSRNYVAIMIAATNKYPIPPGNVINATPEMLEYVAKNRQRFCLRK